MSALADVLSAALAAWVGLGGWTWVIVGCLLLTAELVLPGLFLFWFGLAAGLTGIVALFVDIGWQRELLLFVAAAIVAVLAGREISRLGSREDSARHLNRRADALVGHTFVLVDPIVSGDGGRIRHGDTLWRVSGPDLPAGARVRVDRADGGRLVVVAADAAVPGGPATAV